MPVTSNGAGPDFRIKAHQPVHGQLSRSGPDRRCRHAFGKSLKSPSVLFARIGHGSAIQRLGRLAGSVRSLQPDGAAETGDGIDDKAEGQDFGGHLDGFACRFGTIGGIDCAMVLLRTVIVEEFFPGTGAMAGR